MCHCIHKELVWTSCTVSVLIIVYKVEMYVYFSQPIMRGTVLRKHENIFTFYITIDSAMMQVIESFQASAP